MSIQCKILNRICRMLYHKEYKHFIKSSNIKKVQSDYLMKLIKKNADTIYGKKYNFKNINSYEDFLENVPLTTYEDYEPYIEMMAKGKKRVLTYEDVRLFELTSGSSGGKKLIPYTKSLKNEFQKGIKPWLYDIYKNVDGVEYGKSYWSITPVTAGKSYTESGIPIGFEEDAEYFGFIEQKLMQRLFAVDSSVKFSNDINSFYFETASQLINCNELTLISVWNPTFLTILCDFICDNAEQLKESLPKSNHNAFLDSVKENHFDKIFPHLKIISCWADGSASNYIHQIEKRFPNVYIQPKGLLATECFTSFPLKGEIGSRLSIYSHFFEFKRLSDGKIFTADKLDIDKYEIIVTTGGGFYRYCIGDIIQVLEVYPDKPPKIKFLHRTGTTSDLFGEKLTEEFVRNTCLKLGLDNKFCLLAPEENYYCLYTTAENITDDTLDKALCESYHYNYCRQLGQLKKSVVIIVSGNPETAYVKRLTDDGMRIGDIKPAYLSKKTDWKSYFKII
ncbi:MAG: GH3 auxin-responsive promoter family protein [Acutalibacteraceae bacterium]|nr:GH3 auxin-responsive promoter family protein [Acutalibacteraceae bacterium]